MPKRLVTVGDLVVDIVLDARLPVVAGAHQTAASLRFEAGGACTTILAARRMGLDVAALGALGDDLQGRFLRDRLAEAGVDVSALHCPPESTTTTVIALADTASGEHVFLGHYGAGSPTAMSDAARAQLERADAVFIPGYTLAENRLAGLTAVLMDWLAGRATPLYFDVGPFAGRAPPALLSRVLRRANTLLLTADEIPLVADGAGLDGCRALLERFPKLTIVLKLAEAGCRVMTRGREIACPGFATAVVDTAGAGDAFAGAWIWADLQGYSAAESGTIANAMGAACVARLGAGGHTPGRADVSRLLREHNTGIDLRC